MKKLLTILISLASLSLMGQSHEIAPEYYEKLIQERNQKLVEMGLSPFHVELNDISLQSQTGFRNGFAGVNVGKNNAAEGEWLSWVNGNYNNSIGIQGDFLFDVAARFEPADLSELAGYQISSVSIVPGDMANFTLKIWQGQNTPQEIYSQVIGSIVPNQENVIELETPVLIDESQDLWVGYQVGGSHVFPAGVDSGPAVTGKGDMLQVDGVWYSMNDEFSLDFNWMISAWVEPAAEPDAPAAPLQLTATADENGQLIVDLDWVNPSATFGGEPLGNLDNILIYRGETLLQTISNPVIGGAGSLTDSGLEAAGFVSYAVVAENENGNGPSALATVFAGPDVPEAPSNVTLSEVDNHAFISWEAPQSGLNGGFINPDLTTYTVVRMPGILTVAEGITDTSFTDNAIPGIGNYSYKITAFNEQGQGGTANSNTAALGLDGILFYETFDYQPGILPTGWERIGVSHNWGVSHSQVAGGDAPELKLNWVPGVTGVSRLVSPVINLENNEAVRLTFLQYLDNFASSNNEKVGMDFTTDGGNSWINIWEQDLTNEDIPQGEYDYVFNVPSGVSSMQLGLRFEGNSYNIDYWYLDNIIIEPLLNSDLLAANIAGNVYPAAGEETIYTVSVQNAGQMATDNFVVKLMGEGDVELSSVSGELLQPGETADFSLSWTPQQTGDTFIYGRVDFPGDENPANNTTANFDIKVLPEGSFVAQVGTQSTLAPTNIPFDFFWKASLSQTLYYPEELGLTGGVLTALQYKNEFINHLPAKAIKIWVGETPQNNLVDGWIDVNELVLVFEGTVDFPQGKNDIFIPLDTPYPYAGGNLVVFASREFENQWFGSSNKFYASADPGSARTIRRTADELIDPANPGFFLHSDWYPNTTLFFSTDGLGALEGLVSDGDAPLEGVEVRLAGSQTKTFTDEEGNYSFPFVLPGSYDVEFSLFGYFNQTVELAEVFENQATILDVTLEAIPQYTVSGSVEGNNGLVPDNAVVRLEGYDNYIVNIEADGDFVIEDVFEGEYQFSIIAPGYEIFVNEALMVDADIDLGLFILSEIILLPGSLAIDYDNYGAGNALFSWSIPLGNNEFRYDNGTVTTALGTYSSSNQTVLGAAHSNIAELFEMSWIWASDDSNTIIESVKVWVFGLDENGIPDGNNLLYTADDVPVSHDGQWSTYIFSQPVAAPNGFFIGIGAEGFLALAAEEGNDSEWPFIPNTQFFSSNALTEDFNAIENFGFPWNFFIRAIGNDYGSINNKSALGGDEMVTLGGELKSFKNTTPGYVGAPYDIIEGEKSVNKSITGFNVFLENMEEPVAFTEDMEYLFTDLPEGNLTAGVQSVYNTGVSDIVTINFDLVYPVEVTVNITTNSGGSAEGTQVELINGEFSQYAYSGQVDASGVMVFPSVRKGLYSLEVILDNYEVFVLENVDIQSDVSLDVQLIERLDAPVNLMVANDGLESGQVLFSWNNPLHGWTESFEEGSLPEDWSQIITNTNTQSGYANTWQIVETVQFSNPIVPQDGQYQAFIMWSFLQQNEWLISPEFVAPAGDLVFWYHGTNGSPFGDNYYVKITQDDGDTWDILWNSSTHPYGVNHYTTPVTIDLSLYAGNNVRLAWHADDGPNGVGLWSTWAIDNISVGDQSMDLKDFVAGLPDEGKTSSNANKNSNVLNYNVFLDGVLVAEGVNESQFLFNNIEMGSRVAAVQAVYASGVSEIVSLDFTLNPTWLLSLISEPAGSATLTGSAWYAEGSEVLVSASANNNYMFVNWTDQNGEIISEDPAFFYTMPGNNRVLTANFAETEQYSVTFNIDMTNASGFNPFQEDVALTGSMHNWAVLGTNHRNQVMAGNHETMVYTKTFLMEPGVYSYKYFLNEGEHDHEWEEGDNREIFVGSDMEIFDTWGVQTPTSITEMQLSGTTHIFPNPFNDFIEVSGAEENSRLIITNILGEIIIDEILTTNRLNTSNFQPGIYVIYLENGNRNRDVHKLIKQ
ncbi:MAG: T9SS C-terminal target domain-containing protein [Bacteroidetes bacterium]|nr:MAG: T9SS C-terminal target domain-containing protein [Bacteroidota bacterium]